MRQFKDMHIIGIDHGYGNLKTVNGIFPASVLPFDHEPIHTQDLLVYGGKYYVIGSDCYMIEGAIPLDSSGAMVL